MRCKIIPAILVGLCVGTGYLHAQNSQPYPLDTTIAVPDVSVRSGPSTTFYETSRLRMGERVKVLYPAKDQPGWVAIVPPAGSFSWINAKSVKQVDNRLGLVDVDGGKVPVLAGSGTYQDQPNRESTVLSPGTIVVIVDRARAVGSDTWLPIAVQPSEVRYIPIEAFRGPNVAAQTVTTQVATPNWTLTNNNNQTPYNNNRLANNTGQPLNNPNFIQPASTNRTALSPNLTTPVALTTGAKQWSNWGTLRQTAFRTPDNVDMYVIEGKDGRYTYVSTPPGKSLQSFVNKTICVYGQTLYSSDSALRQQYILASDLSVQP